MSKSKEQVIQDLETLNEITETLNRAVDVRSALDRALARLIDVMELETGWIFVREPEAGERWGGVGFRLVAHHNLPPAMKPDSAEAWDKGCDCQTLCLKDKLNDAYNEVRCSRLASVSGDRRDLSVHASTPLRSGDQVLGILNVAAPSWDSFSERTLSLLTNVGCQVGIALQRARFYDLLQERRIHEQVALLDFTNQLLSRLDLEDMMHFLVEEVRNLLDVDACALLLPDEEDPAYLRFSAASGWRSDPVAAGRRVPADERTSSGKAMLTQSPVVLEDNSLRETTPWMADWLPVEEFQAAGVVPLIADGRSIGALLVDTRRPRCLEEDDMRFLQLMANQAALALEKERLHREEIQRQRLEEELAVARQIQLSMLPPQSPQAAGWEFAVHYRAARQVGGDFYDFFDLPSDGDQKRLGLVVADVADKGVPAALFMALSRTTIRNVGISDRTPGAALARANELIQKDSQTDLFLTAFYAVLDVDVGHLVYANAGHNPPLWYKPDTGKFRALSADGIALGVLPDIHLEDVAIEVARGDLIVFYTDGVTEAMNAQLEEFGMEQLKSSIAAGGDTAQGTVQAIVDAVNEHVGPAPRWDDFTLLVVRRTTGDAS